MGPYGSAATPQLLSTGYSLCRGTLPDKEEDERMRRVNVDGLTRLPSFSHAVVVDDTIYVSGTLGTLDDSGTLIEGGAGPQTTQSLKNFADILSECGATLSDVVKVDVYLADMEAFNEMNDAYLEVFGGSPPARITVGGVDLALGAAVEMDCIARRPT